MGESVSHVRLVESLLLWVATTYFRGDTGHILVDSRLLGSFSTPPRINGFVPDIYAENTSDGSLIIGEAKTARDIENRHTRAQLTAFLNRCAEDVNSLFVLAVPWDMERFAKVLLRNIQGQSKTCEVRAIVLEQLQG